MKATECSVPDGLLSHGIVDAFLQYLEAQDGEIVFPGEAFVMELCDITTSHEMYIGTDWRRVASTTPNSLTLEGDEDFTYKWTNGYGNKLRIVRIKPNTESED